MSRIACCNVAFISYGNLLAICRLLLIFRILYLARLTLVYSNLFEHIFYVAQ